MVPRGHDTQWYVRCRGAHLDHGVPHNLIDVDWLDHDRFQRGSASVWHPGVFPQKPYDAAPGRSVSELMPASLLWQFHDRSAALLLLGYARADSSCLP